MAFDDWSSQTTSFLPAFRILTSNHQRRSLTRRFCIRCHQRSAVIRHWPVGPLAPGGRPGESRRWSETSWRLDKDGAAVDPMAHMALFVFVSRMGHPFEASKSYFDGKWWTMMNQWMHWIFLDDTNLRLVWTSEALPNLAYLQLQYIPILDQ